MTDVKANAEAEANHFAMQLLVPTELLKADLAELGELDMNDDKMLAQLAKRYGVSLTLMAKRIMDVTEGL